MSGKVLVAGVNGGIGAAVAEHLRTAGELVYGVDRDTTDITLPGNADHAVSDAVAAMGGLTGVVHAIGMSGRRFGDGPVTDCTDEAWDQVLRVNLESAFRLIRASLPKLSALGGGSIVLIGSALAMTLDDDFLTVAYATAKGALIPLVRSAAYTGAPHGVRVNIVAPGLVDTPMAARALSNDAISSRLPALQRLGGRAQTADEIADTVTWLLSGRSAGLTGSVLPVDRAWTLR
jgi:NAD(P)-dependent dehydrogenase (short-subunit alcohol dehydrogenase family)